MRNTLYGDGIHDDYPAIQEMIDSGICEVNLPAPAKHYLISHTIELPSDFRLVLPRYAEIRLSDGANCAMVRNKTAPRREPFRRKAKNVTTMRDHDTLVNAYLYEWSDAPEDTAHNIELCGGIWNCNNLAQRPNPFWQGQDKIQWEKYLPGYLGVGIFFYNVKGLKLTNLTIKDPVVYAAKLDTVSYFTISDIVFDFNYGNPAAINMDGIHLEGNCHFGRLTNLQGACYDDLVALCADEGSDGPITNITVDGIYSENCHSAVRLLTVKNPVVNIHISNVYGTYYQYCVAFSKYYYPEPTTGWYDAVSIDHLYVSKAVRHDIYGKAGTRVWPLIFIEDEVVARHVYISDLHRREEHVPIETIHVGPGARLDDLVLSDITTENNTGEPMPLLVNNGRIRTLRMERLSTGAGAAVTGAGVIESIQ